MPLLASGGMLPCGGAARTDCGAPSPAHVQPGPPPPLMPAAVQFVLSDSLPTSSYVVPTQQVRSGGRCRSTPVAGLAGQPRRMRCMPCTCCWPRPAECRVCVGTRCLHACATNGLRAACHTPARVQQTARSLPAIHLHVHTHRPPSQPRNLSYHLLVISGRSWCWPPTSSCSLWPWSPS